MKKRPSHSMIMEIILYSKPADDFLKNILNSLERPGLIRISECKRIEDFKEAVRVNTKPRPVIIFYISEASLLRHLFEIKEYITDASLFLVLPNNGCYRRDQLERLFYPRFIFYRDEDLHLLAAMLKKITIKE